MRSINDLANDLGQPPGYISWAIGCGLVPAPDLCPQRRRYYSAEQYRKALRAFCRAGGGEEFFTMTELCRRLEVSTHRFQTWLRAGRVPEPIAVKGRREVWSHGQLVEIKQSLPELLALKPYPTLPNGYYTQRSAAEELGVPYITWTSWVRNGSVPKPSRRIAGIRWPLYSESDLRAIRMSKGDYSGWAT